MGINGLKGQKKEAVKEGKGKENNTEKGKSVTEQNHQAGNRSH